MSLHNTQRPVWLTFDCYGTLIQWDEGLQAAVREILRTKDGNEVAPAKLIEVYDRHEHALERTGRSARSPATDCGSRSQNWVRAATKATRAC
jgi:2-haloacid dehalogenase